MRPGYWTYVPDPYREVIRSSTRIRYINPIPAGNVKPSPVARLAIRQARIFSREFDGVYDYLFSYWGNYAGTYAYIANLLLSRPLPFSFILHAGTDLYRDQIRLSEKILAAHKVITVCEFNIAYLKDLYPLLFEKFSARLLVHHLGLDLAAIPFVSTGREDAIILTVGSFVPQKGFATVIQALHLLRDRKPEVKLVMVGDGPELAALKREVRRLGLQDRVEFTGWLTFAEVQQRLESATLLVHPSSGLGDAVPTVIKEAQAAGLPVVAADVGGIPEILDHGRAGSLFPPRDAQALADRISQLLSDKQILAQYAKDGRAFAEKTFDMFKNGRRLSDHLQAP